MTQYKDLSLQQKLIFEGMDSILTQLDKKQRQEVLRVFMLKYFDNCEVKK